MSNTKESMRRLRWRCRRGLLELDLVFARFLEQRYPHLDRAQQEAFYRLLERQDATLLAYLNGKEAPAEPELRAIVKEIL